MSGLVLGVRNQDELSSGIPKYFAKVQSINSAKYYVGILGRSFYGCKHACGIARMRQACFSRGRASRSGPRDKVHKPDGKRRACVMELDEKGIN